MGLALDLENYHPSVLLHCWLGHLTCKIVSEVTYNVSSGTSNPTIPYWYFIVNFESVRILPIENLLQLESKATVWLTTVVFWKVDDEVEGLTLSSVEGYCVTPADTVTTARFIQRFRCTNVSCKVSEIRSICATHHQSHTFVRLKPRPH